MTTGTRMIPLRLAAAFALALPATAMLAPLPLAAQAASPLDAVAAHIRATATMTADFTQTDRSGGQASGRLLLKRPGKVRFQYTNQPMLIVADGRSLNMIDYEVKQVQRWPIGNSPLTALLDPGRDLARYGRMLPTSNPGVVSVEVKDPKRPEYGTITMIFVRDAKAPAGLSLHSWVALDSQNNRTTVRLRNIRYNGAIADSAFRWNDPRRITGRSR
jgi:outer membrane lipoprotein-sorting protein